MRQPAVAHQGGDLFAGEGGIDGHIDSANGERGKIGDSPLPAVFADEGDAISLLRTPAQKCRGQGPNPLINLVRGDGLPMRRTRPATRRRAGWRQRMTRRKRSLMVEIAGDGSHGIGFEHAE